MRVSWSCSSERDRCASARSARVARRVSCKDGSCAPAPVGVLLERDAEVSGGTCCASTGSDLCGLLAVAPM